MRKFDLKSLTDDELLRLNHATIAELKARQRLAERKQTAAFDLGDAVAFDAPEGGRRLRGTVVRVNRKSLTIATGGGIWRVAPCFVSKEKGGAAPATSSAKLLPLRRSEK